MFETQLDLGEFWLRAESFVLPRHCLGLWGLFLAHSPRLTQRTTLRGCLPCFGAQQPYCPTNASGRTVLGAGENDAAVWGGKQPWPMGVPAGICLTLGPASHPSSGSGFRARWGADTTRAAGKTSDFTDGSESHFNLCTQSYSYWLLSPSSLGTRQIRGFHQTS